MTRIYSIALEEALKAGNGLGYSEQVAQEIDAMIQAYLTEAAVSEDPDLASRTAAGWMEAFRERVNKKEMSVSWGANFLALLVKTICIEGSSSPELSGLCTVFRTVYHTEDKGAHWFPHS